MTSRSHKQLNVAIYELYKRWNALGLDHVSGDTYVSFQRKKRVVLNFHPI